MDLQTLEDPVGKYALLAMIAAAAWKIWLRLKQDTRNDRSEVREHKAHGSIVTEYDKVVETLREEVSRLAQTLDKLSEELGEERKERYAAEQRSRALQERVETLERKLRALGHTP